MLLEHTLGRDTNLYVKLFIWINDMIYYSLEKMDATPRMEFMPTITHGGRYLQYNIFGNPFEITAKYHPPIMPIE
jgi:hypothetical protein